jgi:hypothetical protein
MPRAISPNQGNDHHEALPQRTPTGRDRGHIGKFVDVLAGLAVADLALLCASRGGREQPGRGPRSPGKKPGRFPAA